MTGSQITAIAQELTAASAGIGTAAAQFAAHESDGTARRRFHTVARRMALRIGRSVPRLGDVLTQWRDTLDLSEADRHCLALIGGAVALAATGDPDPLEQAARALMNWHEETHGG